MEMRAVGVVGWGLWVAMLGGCRAKAPVAAGLMPLTLQTDWYPQPEMGGFYQAQLEGLYRAAGLEVTIAPGGPAIVAERAVASGVAQFAMGSSDKVLVSVAQGIPLVAVAATMQQDPQALMVHAESPVRGFADLEGRAVAAKPGSIWFQYLLRRFALKRVREVPATYSVATFVQDPEYIQQAFVTSEPFFAEKAGVKVRTLLIHSTGFEPYRVVFTSREFLAAHPEVVARFVTASMEGWRRYLADPARVNAELQRLNPAMNPEQMRYSVETLKAQHFIDGEGTAESHLGHMTAERWAATNRQLTELGVTARAVDPTTAYTLQFAP